MPCLDTEPLDRDPTTPALEPDCALSISLGGELRRLDECRAPAPAGDRLAEATEVGEMSHVTERKAVEFRANDRVDSPTKLAD